MSRKKGAKAYNFGLSRPIIAQYAYTPAAGQTPASVTYSNAFQCGEAMNTTVTPNYATGELYGDNKKVDEVSELKDASVSIGSTTMPLIAYNVLYGHTISTSGDAEQTDKTSDTPNYVGYGFSIKNSDGSYDACFLTKVRFSEGAENFQTKGDGINYVTPAMDGTAMAWDLDDTWRKKAYGFSSEAEAIDWVCDKMGIDNTFTGDGLTVSVDADIDITADLDGVYIDDLQYGIKVGANAISGVLKYVTGYEGYSETVSEQSGNYIALHVSASSGATVSVAQDGTTKTPDTTTGYVVLRITDTTKALTVTATKSGKTKTKTFDLSGLTLRSNT